MWIRRKPQPMTICEGCGEEWAAKAMSWTDIGLYRCRRCNPDPGPPHEAQAPQQNARSHRYADAARARYRCTECGCKIRKHGYSHMPWRGEPEVPRNVELCDSCVGPEPFEHGWMGFELVRY